MADCDGVTVTIISEETGCSLYDLSKDAAIKG